MTTPAQGNLPESSAKFDGGFEASGLSPEEAERLAAAFKPSWEFDEAPFAEGGGLRGADLSALEASAEAREVHAQPDSTRSQAVAAHAPPARVETHEPEVSVIIDRSITAAQVETQVAPSAPMAPMASPFAAPAVSPTRVVAPVARSRFNADESLELPATLKKSNKGLFIGVGAAAAAAVLVFAVRAAMSSQEEPAPTSASTAAAAAPPVVQGAQATTSPIPPPAPVPVTTPAALPIAPSPPNHAAAVAATPPPRPAPHVAAVHHQAPAPKPAAPKPAGGIVRDVPF